MKAHPNKILQAPQKTTPQRNINLAPTEGSFDFEK